ncbi:unnamed protein product, partial [Closterium sp. NIES-53]
AQGTAAEDVDPLGQRGDSSHPFPPLMGALGESAEHEQFVTQEEFQALRSEMYAMFAQLGLRRGVPASYAGGSAALPMAGCDVARGAGCWWTWRMQEGVMWHVGLVGGRGGQGGCDVAHGAGWWTWRMQEGVTWRKVRVGDDVTDAGGWVGGDVALGGGCDVASIGLVMEVARTSMIHAAAPHFLWPFAARYAAHQLNLWPRVSLPETSPTLRWTGKVGEESVFRVWAIDFDVWVDNLQLFLQCDSRDGVSLFDHMSGVSTAPATTAKSAVCSQWTTRDAVARLAVRSHLPPAERAHFGQYKTAKSLYHAAVARYSSPATAALSRLMFSYLFPDLAAFATVADLISHLRTSDARNRAALPTADHFLSLCPTELTVDLLEERLAAAEKSILAVVGGATTARARVAGVVEGTAGAAAVAVEEAEEVAVELGVVPGVGALMEVVEAAAEVVEAAAAVVEVAAAVVLVEVQPRSVEALVVVSVSSNSIPERPHRPSSFFPHAAELPRWHDLLRQNVAIFDLDFDAILAAMYALTDSAEGDCYLSVPPDPGIEAAALGASASVAPGTCESAAPNAVESALSDIAPTEALHTFTLDSGASRNFFRDSTTLTPLSRPFAVSLADPSGSPDLAHSSTVLPCPAAPSGLLSGLHLPSFSTNLVSEADLQDAWVDQFAPGGQRVTHCTCSRTGRHLATFTCRLGSSLYTLTNTSPPVSASGHVAASSQVFVAASRSSPASAPCSCRPLSHKTLLWHHRLGHPSLPRLRGMASRTLVSDLPRSLPPLPPGPAPTCVPCVEGRQRAAPHSSTFPPTEAPLQTHHMDVWGPARVRGQGHEHYFLLVVDDNSRYTTVFPLCSKGEVPEVLIDWIRGARRQLSECFGSDLHVLRLHSDRGGEFSSDLLRAFCRAEGIRQMFTLPTSPQQNGIVERRIGMVMDVARTSMIHAAAPHFLWPFAVQYAAHQINLQPRVSLPETTPTLRWTGKVGDAYAFRV